MGEPLKVGDAVELDGTRGTVLTEEKDGFVWVFIDPDREEIWESEKCTLILKTEPQKPT